jgi:hypothetical protein
MNCRLSCGCRGRTLPIPSRRYAGEYRDPFISGPRHFVAPGRTMPVRLRHYRKRQPSDVDDLSERQAVNERGEVLPHI